MYCAGNVPCILCKYARPVKNAKNNIYCLQAKEYQYITDVYSRFGECETQEEIKYIPKDSWRWYGIKKLEEEQKKLSEIYKKNGSVKHGI